MEKDKALWAKGYYRIAASSHANATDMQALQAATLELSDVCQRPLWKSQPLAVNNTHSPIFFIHFTYSEFSK